MSICVDLIIKKVNAQKINFKVQVFINLPS